MYCAVVFFVLSVSMRMLLSFGYVCMHSFGHVTLEAYLVTCIEAQHCLVEQSCVLGLQ